MNRVSQLGPDGYDKFKKCLRMSDQNYLADILNKTEQELRNCDKTNRSNQDPELANTLQGKIIFVIFLLCRECLRYSKCK